MPSADPPPTGELAAFGPVPDGERDALRAQAAAVAAQQAAMTDEEMHLTQRRAALEKQEAQLASHLEERRRRLVELQEQSRLNREALQRDREAMNKEAAESRGRLAEALAAAGEAEKQAKAERARVVELRRRLKRRWRRDWQAHDAALRRRDQEMISGQTRLQKEAESMTAERLRFNGEVELGRRQLQDQWLELALAQQQWEACLNREHADRHRGTRESEARATAIAKRETALAARERQTQRTHARLIAEIQGLENRARNQRRLLAETGRATALLIAAGTAGDAPVPAALELSAFPTAQAVEAVDGGPVEAKKLQLVADRLGDQRLHLLEQWRGLLEVHEAWRRERETATAELEGATQRLAERERDALALEPAAHAASAAQRQRYSVLTQLHVALEAWQARLTAREAAWEAERSAVLAEAQAREEAAAAVTRRIETLGRRRGAQRRKEAEEWAAARERYEACRRQYTALWEECRQHREALALERRDLAARALAVERMRLALLARSPKAAAAEQRVERLRRRSYARLKAADRQGEANRQALAAEAARLDDYAGQVRRLETDVAAGREELARERFELEERRAAAEKESEQRSLEMKRLLVRQEQDALELARLREAVERFVVTLIDEAEEAGSTASQAA
jgi:hypothetical protein